MPERGTPYVKDLTVGPGGEGVCASACVYAFFAGSTRYAVRTRIGIHQFYDADTVRDPLAKTANAFARSSDQLLYGILLEYTVRMGVDPAVLALASAVAPWEKMRWLNDEELVRLRIDNAETTFTPLSVEAFGRRGAYVETISHSVYNSFRHRIYCREPNKSPLVAVVGPMDSLETFTRVANGASVELKFADGSKRRFRTSVAALNESQPGKGDGSSVELNVIGASMNDFQNATYVSFEGNYDRPTGDQAYWMSFALKGDRRKIGIVARSCVG